MNKGDIAERIKGMDNEEKALAVKMLPTDLLLDELKRRCNETENVVRTIKELVREP